MTISDETTLFLALTGPQGCVTEDTLLIFERDLPVLPIENDTVYCFGDLEPFVIPNLDSRNQYFLDGRPVTNELLIPRPAGLNISMIDQFGCVNEGVVRVIDGCLDLTIPNVFTPDGDGINDIFLLTGLEPLSANLPPDNCDDKFLYISIINRAGKEVFRSENREFQWDGGDAPSGTYYYIAQYINSSFKGFVQLLR